MIYVQPEGDGTAYSRAGFAAEGDTVEYALFTFGGEEVVARTDEGVTLAAANGGSPIYRADFTGPEVEGYYRFIWYVPTGEEDGEIVRVTADATQPGMFATATEIGVRLGRTLESAESLMAEQLIETVTGLIAEAASQDDAWAAALDPVPSSLRGLCREVVVRAMANPGALRSLSEQLGSYSYSQAFSDMGLALTDGEVRMVRRVVYNGEASSSGELDSPIETALRDLGAASAQATLLDLGPDDPAYYLGT